MLGARRLRGARRRQFGRALTIEADMLFSVACEVGGTLCNVGANVYLARQHPDSSMEVSRADFTPLALGKPDCNTLRISRPQSQNAAKRYSDAAQKWLNRPQMERKVWVLIPFGFMLNMLMLHLETLAPIVDHFLITEAKETHARNAEKPTLLTDQLYHGRLPPKLADKITVRIVDLYATAVHGHCSERPVGYARTSCIETWQRYELFDMLSASSAQASDLAIIADSDEIASPPIVYALKVCYPFDESSNDTTSGKLVLMAIHFEFGMHCFIGNDWKYGPHVYAVGHLLRAFRPVQQHNSDGPISESRSESARFSNMRHVAFQITSWPKAAWHFSSFGSSHDIVRKYASWSHSNMFLTENEQTLRRRATAHRETLSRFRVRNATTELPQLGGGFRRNGYEYAALDHDRIERCARNCLEAYPQPRHKPGQKWVSSCRDPRHEPKTGKHLYNASFELRRQLFPQTFSHEKYATLLFGRPFMS